MHTIVSFKKPQYQRHQCSIARPDKSVRIFRIKQLARIIRRVSSLVIQSLPTCCNYKQNKQPELSLCCLDCAVLVPGKMQLVQKEAVADIPEKHLLFGWISSPKEFITKSLKEAVADPTWVQSTIATTCDMH